MRSFCLWFAFPTCGGGAVSKTTLTLQDPCFFGAKGNPPKKTRVFLFAEPFQSLENRGKCTTKSKENRKTKQINREKASAEIRVEFIQPKLWVNFWGDFWWIFWGLFSWENRTIKSTQKSTAKIQIGIWEFRGESPHCKDLALINRKKKRKKKEWRVREQQIQTGRTVSTVSSGRNTQIIIFRPKSVENYLT